MVRHAVQISLLRIIFSGIMALSPTRFSQAMNTARVATPPINRPITVAESHGWVLPPYSRARRIMMAQGAKSAKPARSNFWQMMDHVPPGTRMRRSGMETRVMTMAARPPMGKLM